ncbi:50S ribosomal protein L3 N(5)-glutamine methyltransferase [Aquabacterium sp. CECT 9606]|uniref:50S ribosomal protein L3 N(5)-glutamine methyltransferase n=1 Tax=Aquabacterium sp. CECT 9606 TaxID=2845822 RepID=UPI001E4C63AF|nr:50S ribosomal protein L3 N(5)-glutamine methyltransferase [Aquabacterium sp. CECT 9606]CAH0352583.1 50S ribosomal protein L3 glutamine methyltransferase [Aquabacterium sp. CECT 9606]
MSTVIELIETASARLTQAGVSFGHGTINAFDEAAWLVLWKLGLPLDDLDGVADQPVEAAQHTEVNALVTQRIETRKPAAYLTQEAWLQGVPFYVDERTIVPRSFIAELIADGSIDHWLSERTLRVLDLCTGNGSLAVIAALAYPDVTVDGLDISTDALAVARINVDKHDLADRITLIQSDGLAQARGPYDLILCNPPYVNAQSMRALPAEYLAEPELALASGDDGMDFTRALLATLKANPGRYLSPEAILVLEIGNERENFERAFPELEVVWLETSGGDSSVCVISPAAITLA